MELYNENILQKNMKFFDDNNNIKLFGELDNVSFTETDEGMAVNIRLYPTDEQYMAALGPCGK